MKSVKVLRVLVMVGVLALGSSVGNLRSTLAAAEGPRIAVIDMQRALQSVEAGKKAKQQLEKEFNQRKKELQNEEAALKKMDEEFKKQSLVMSDEARGKKLGEIQARAMKLQEWTQRSQMEIQQKEQQLTEPLVNKIKGLIAETAKTRGYTLVLQKSDVTVLYSLESDDLTTEVVEKFNKGNKS